MTNVFNAGLELVISSGADVNLSLFLCPLVKSTHPLMVSLECVWKGRSMLDEENECHSLYLSVYRD